MRRILCILLVLTTGSTTAFGQKPQRYESKNFLIRTDLPKETADEMLQKLETMLKLMSAYWAVPNRKQIECVVVGDLKNWPNGSIDPRALPKLKSGGGITVADTRIRGNQTTIRAVAFSNKRLETVQHEAVHAFAYYSFGHCGPDWYSEGMAELGAYWVEGSTSVTAPRYVTQYLRNGNPLTVREITTGKTSKSGSWKTYASRWALCHLLSNNENYSRKFRPLGLSMLSKKQNSFKGVYGRQFRELEFEFQFFLQHVEPGYDVNLCRWDWDTRFRKLRSGKKVTGSVRANAGWQASRLRVEKDTEYSFQADGTWKLSKDGEATDANGTAKQAGQLQAVILSNWKLGEPFPLGTSGKFKAPAAGDLYLRCTDNWTSLSDNSGELVVSIEPAR